MNRRRLVPPVLGALSLLTLVLCLSTGAVSLPLRCVPHWLPTRASTPPPAGCPDTDFVYSILSLRLPRILLAISVGSGLGLVGAALQALFRNPLVDPGLIGVSSGAALLAATTMVLGGSALSSPPLLLLAGFLGGLASALLVQRLAQVGGRIFIPALILSGVAMNAVAGALIGLLSYVATDAQLRNLTFWTLGSLGGATWSRVLWAGPVALCAAIPLVRLATPLHALVLGESAAAHLGIATDRLKRRTLLLCVLLVACAVSLCGIIGFVGLVVPHVVRLLLGPDQRRVLPASAVLGALLLLWADLISRTLVAPAELPLGTVTAAMGSPFFIALLLRERARWAH